MGSTKKQNLIGKVLSSKMEKTVNVLVTRQVAHPIYRKRVKRYKKYLAHVSTIKPSVGDIVKITSTRPISKRKRWRVVELIRKTVTDPSEMIQTEWDHTIYEIEGDVSDLSNIKNSELLDKKVIKRKTEATLILGKEMTMEEELGEYLSYILELDESKTKNILGVFSDYAKEAGVE